MEPTQATTPRFSLSLFLARIAWREWLPSRGNVLFTLVIVFSLFWAQSAHALPWMEPAAASTSTGSWPYQGRLATSAGTPITATVSMIFRLYSASTGGVPLWEEQWTGSNSVQVSDGLFNVMLGSLTVIPQSVVTANTSLWLGITAGTDDEMTPRVQLGSVPFAAQALTVPDGSIGTAKIAAAGITTAKIANGAVTLAKLGADVSLTPPDGSITTAKLANGAVSKAKLGADVSLMAIQSGEYIAYWNLEPGWTLTTGSGTYVKHITFPLAFQNIPAVVVSLKQLDISNSVTRVEVSALNVTTTGFDIQYKTWSSATVWSVGVSWIAYAPQ